MYKPDWRTPERRDYTVALAHILAGLLPDGIDGSISTVPGSFKSWIQSPNDVELMVTHLAECAQALHGIREKTGKEIHLGLEPEPSCFLETTYETVRFWWNRFGPMFAAEIRRKRVNRMRAFTHWRWHLDEVYVKINGEMHYLWRAVDHEGEVLESFASKDRDKAAALKFMKRLMKRHGRPKAVITDGLRS